MNKPRPCGCKGLRSCYICEKDYNIVKSNFINLENGKYIYCYICNKAWPGWSPEDNSHGNHTGESIEYPGVFIQTNFLSKQEENDLLATIDSMTWDPSQSGRRKQNFGPKCNFKKKRIRVGDFQGFPIQTEIIQTKFEDVSIMKGFQTIEQCSLEYTPERGASIDPHIDDCWIWGERIVTVNLLSDSILTMTYNDKPNRYNLDCVKTYPSILTQKGFLNTTNSSYVVKPLNENDKYPVVRIPMPRGSLLIMYNSARYDWEHQVLREDIISRRVCLAYREFTPPYLEAGEKFEEGKSILQKAKNFY
ncbi:alpha-ketoglutarate-dependent dioxygenase alkB homolog 4 [Diabrotica virgifera virgifera]|uniref:Alpha-ketoglutarate-dependent dioxygenase alkB homolog 4 n=1 Tax=Diabrotica virgifera virgifera TaxID=50390 RepID=A0ABM5IPR0_DIAVI|nr:alpha-ketoglutarate-dependent dioxygenase alkB homolog 4 [Diabrotica virgifera virgifera]